VQSTISVTLDEVIRRIAGSMNMISPSSHEVRVLLASKRDSEPSGQISPKPSLFFTSGVRLSASQVSQFVTLVREQLRGHNLHDAHIVQAAMGQLSPRKASISHRTAAMQDSLRHQSSSSGQVKLTKGLTSAPGQHGTKYKSRTEVLRAVFDLLDVDGKGCITRPELTPLLHLVVTECHDDNHNNLLRTSASHKAAVATAFSPLKRSATTGTSNRNESCAATNGGLQQGRFHCDDPCTFVKYCRLAAFAVIPLLDRSPLDAWEFPHLGMLAAAELRSCSDEVPSSLREKREQRTLKPLLAALCA
jgi:hypothetical protein